MKKSILLFFLFPLFSFSQNSPFTFNDAIPVTRYGDTLRMPWAGGIDYPQWSAIDLNQDGRNDLFIFDRSNNRITTLINDGNGAYHDETAKYAPMFPTDLSGWAYLYDWNCDGLPDLFTSSYCNCGIAQYQASYSNSTWTFSLANPQMLYWFNSGHTNVYSNSYVTPNFDDIDGDGDMDIVVQVLSCVGTYGYYRNYSMEDYGTCDSLNDYRLVTNSWGNFQLRSGAYCYTDVYQFGINCPFMENGSYKPERDDTYAQLFTIDLDGDGDKDALVGDSGANGVLRIWNGGTPTNADMVPTTDTLFPSYNVPADIKSFATFGYVEVDGDTLKDLLVSGREWADTHGVLFYKNQGTNAHPDFHFQHDSLFQRDMIDVGEAAAPVFFDADGDGLLDIVIAYIRQNNDPGCSASYPVTALALYKNVGTTINPSFQFVTDDYANIAQYYLQGPLRVTFGDLDSDCDLDMLIGKGDGKLFYVENTGTCTGPANFTTYTNNAFGIDVGNNNAPQIIDLNRDGLLDLVIGHKNGILKYYQNAGSTTSPLFPSLTIDSLGQINMNQIGFTDGYSVPFVFDDSGKYNMLVSNMHGEVLLYDSIDNNLNGTFRFVDTVLAKQYGNRMLGTAYGPNLSVSAGDINGDHFTDMLLGIYTGGIQIYYHTTPVTVSTTNKPEVSFDAYPNPSTTNILNVSFHNLDLNKAYQLEMYNSIGAEVYSKTIQTERNAIDITAFSNGLYLLKLQTESGTVSRKIVIRR